MTRPARVLLLVLAAVIVFAAVGVLVSRPDLVPLPAREGCVATVGDQSVRVNLEQAEHASLIAAISIQRGLPARAATIALATAYQESKLHNIDFGDRDSVGLFQQRPSQGWGTVRQIMDPVYATNRFYDALEKIEGYEEMVKKLPEAKDLPTDTPKSGEPSKPTLRVDGAGRVEQRGDGSKTGTNSAGVTNAPPGYGDARKKFAESATKQKEEKK